MANIINGTDTGSGGLITTGDSSDELQIQTAETTALTITSGQQSAFIAGTAAAPAVTTTGDLNTGIYFPAADNIGFTTGGTIRGRWTTDGLCFGSDTAAANALDDYEEGTWTPSVGGNATYGAQDGRYTKIGNMVYFSGHLIVTTLGTGSVTTVSGLPFTAVSGAGVTGAATISYFTTLAVNVITPVLEVNQAATNMSVYSRVTAGTVAAQVSIFGDGARIYFTGMYRV
jgi:hypothetical protein